MNALKMLDAVDNTDIEAKGIPKVYFHGKFFNRYYAIGMTLFSGTLEDRWKKAGNISELSILLIFKRSVSK